MLIWLSLAFLIAAVVIGSVFVARRALAAWRDVKRLMRTIGVGLDAVADRLDELDRRLSRGAERSGRLQPALARLARSRAELTVLLDAAGGVRSTTKRWRAAVPRVK